VAPPTRVAQILTDPATRGSFTRTEVPAHCFGSHNRHPTLPSDGLKGPPVSASRRSMPLRTDLPGASGLAPRSPVLTFPVPFTGRCRPVRFPGHFRYPPGAVPILTDGATGRRGYRCLAPSLARRQPVIDSLAILGPLLSKRPCRIRPCALVRPLRGSANRRQVRVCRSPLQVAR